MIFSTFLVLSYLTENERHFYSDYEAYYQQKSRVVTVYKESLIDLPTSKENVSVEAVFPSENWNYSAALFLPNTEFKARMLKGSFFGEDSGESVVLGKDVYQELSSAEKKKNQLLFGDESYQIAGVLANSPFNEKILFNGHSKVHQKLFLPLVNTIIISGRSNQQLDSYMEELSQQSTSQLREVSSFPVGADAFDANASRFDFFYQLLLVVSVVSILLQIYQRLSNWRLEMAIRKLSGATGMRLVLDTYRKYFLTLLTSFGIALLITAATLLVLLGGDQIRGDILLAGFTKVLLMFLLINAAAFIASWIMTNQRTVYQLLQEVRE